jgi:hypothetical protein
MEKEKDQIIVYVTGNFAGKDELYNWLKRYATDSDELFVYWNEHEYVFTPYNIDSYDAVLVLNTPGKKLSITTDPGRTIAFMMEPGVRSLHPWMFKGTEQYTRVFSPIGSKPNIEPSHGFMGWYFDRNISDLASLPVPEKTGSLSCIVSSLKQLEGHRLRLNFVTNCKKEIPAMDLFGKGINYISDKMDGLLPYRYSLAIENASIPYYFTEKINDCFLAYTVPLYYGCRNIDKYFPPQSYIPVDINNTAAAIKTIKAIIENDDWNARLEAVKEARELVLNRYQPLAGCATALSTMPATQKRNIKLKPVHTSILQKLSGFINQLSNRQSG